MGKVIPEGKIIAATNGHYEEYDLFAIYRAHRDVPIDALYQAWVEKYPKQTCCYEFEKENFYGWLISQRFLEQVDCCEAFLDDGEINVKEVDPR